MATAAMGIFNHAAATAQGLMGKTAAPTASAAGTNGTSGTNGSSGASSNSATISANDFLTLLVTEMQNQDPTATQDPNEYINQLVSVNSLQQLIGINQTLTTDLGTPQTSTGNDATKQIAGTASDGAGAKSGSLPAGPGSVDGSTATTASQLPAGQQPHGNLSVPGANPSALRVAHALDGRMRGVSAIH